MPDDWLELAMRGCILLGEKSDHRDRDRATMSQSIEAQEANVQAKEEHQTSIFSERTASPRQKNCIMDAGTELCSADNTAKAMPEDRAARNVSNFIILMTALEWAGCRIIAKARPGAPMVANKPKVCKN